MGDMLVKAGDWQTAKRIYANAKLSKTYESWQFKPLLEDRINRAQANVALFNAPEGAGEARMMIDSKFSCMACHQQ
jgi:hypothetical protein